MSLTPGSSRLIFERMAITQFPGKPQIPQEADEVIEGMADAVVALLGSRAVTALSNQPDQIQRKILQRAAEKIAPTAPKSGNVLGTVTSIFEHSERKKWTLAEIRTAVAATGLAATDKQVSNALGYLTRRERLVQLSYGVYFNKDIGAVTISLGDEGVEPHRDNFE